MLSIRAEIVIPYDNYIRYFRLKLSIKSNALLEQNTTERVKTLKELPYLMESLHPRVIAPPLFLEF